MKITQMWKEETVRVLDLVYKNKLDKAKVSAFLDKIIEEKKDKASVMKMRNLYTNTNFDLDIDTIFDTIDTEQLCICGNNTFTYSYKRVPTPVTSILIDKKAERNAHKKKMLEYEAQLADPNLDESKREMLELLDKYEDAVQYKVKQFMNSLYGSQGLEGSYLYNPDTASAVTAQGRELIAEMLWAVEKLLYGTLHFVTMDEFFGYLIGISKEIHPDSQLLKYYITYVPTVKDVMKRLSNTIKCVDDSMHKVDEISMSLYSFIDGLNPVERVYFYYKNNLADLIALNPRIYQIFDSILQSPELFEASGKDVPKCFKPRMELIYDILTEFVICKQSTPRRVYKYKNKTRRGIVVSDTDSVIINLYPWIQMLYELHCKAHKQEVMTSHVLFDFPDLGNKLVNILTSLCVHATVIAGDVICERDRIPQELRNWIDMKSEFLFKRMVVYTGVKKNYMVHITLREGKKVDKISNTGIKLNSSNIHPAVKEQINNLITNNVIKAVNVDPVVVYKGVQTIESNILNAIRGGDLTYGTRMRYSGAKGYKTGVYRNAGGRSAYVWNLLYPEYPINEGDYGYVFDTTLYVAEDCEGIKHIDPAMYDKVIAMIFNNKNEPELPTYGLRSIMIPISENVKQIPSWIIPFIDTNKLIKKHLQPIVTMLPSINLNTISATASDKSTYSPLIDF